MRLYLTVPNCHLVQRNIGAGTKRSKIFLSIVYLWTGRGPEINNGASAPRSRPLRAGGGAGDRARSWTEEPVQERGGWCAGRDGTAAGAAGGVAA